MELEMAGGHHISSVPRISLSTHRHTLSHESVSPFRRQCRLGVMGVGSGWNSWNETRERDKKQKNLRQNSIPYELFLAASLSIL